MVGQSLSLPITIPALGKISLIFQIFIIQNYFLLLLSDDSKSDRAVLFQEPGQPKRIGGTRNVSLVQNVSEKVQGSQFQSLKIRFQITFSYQYSTVFCSEVCLI